MAIQSAQAEELTAPEESAFGLSQAAVILDQGRDDKGLMASALERNMEVWIAIRMMVSGDDTNLSRETKDNLTKLSQFVAETTMKHGVDLPEESLDTLINIDLQISEGLLEGN
jgi:flagellar biosynthesis regulator FlaF